MDAGRYFSDLARGYEKYSGEAHAWHFGLWEPGVRGHQEALLRSNERLLRGLHVDAATHILDVGCGSGGFASWAAQRFGARVTGITIVEEHLELAQRLARGRGVSDRCSFRLCDMGELGTLGERFDVVVNQESFCYAPDDRSYLAGVLRVLRPGGSWRAVDTCVQENGLTQAEAAHHREVCEGYHFHPLPRRSEVRDTLVELGFAEVVDADLTHLVQPTARRVRRLCALPYGMNWLGLDGIYLPRDASHRRMRRGHVTASWSYALGLRRGFLRYTHHSGSRPTDT